MGSSLRGILVWCAGLAVALLPLAGRGAAAAAGEAGPYTQGKAEAEKAYVQKSYAKANELYKQAAALALDARDRRWVDFRLADTQWRSEASTRSADSSRLEQARESLEKMVRDVKAEAERDRVWAEIQESLGDFFWTPAQRRDWGNAWPYYERALDWWAGSSDLEGARAHYLTLVWKLTDPPWQQPRYLYGMYGNVLPQGVLENALRIARTDTDLARAHFLMAMTLRQQGDDRQRRRVPEEFEASLKGGKANAWYDDALYHYAEWMGGQGQRVRVEGGGWSYEPDFPRALELFRRLVTEYKKGETRYFDQAQNAIEAITGPQLGLGVESIFLPDSEIRYQLHWRNVKEVRLSLHAVNLVRDTRFAGREAQVHNWIQQIDLGRAEKVKEWAFATDDKGDYRPGRKEMRWDEGKLPVGAYVLVAEGGKQTTRELILVSDLTLVVKAAGDQALVYVADALSGKPAAGAEVTLWEGWRTNDTRTWKDRSGKTSAEGVITFELTPNTGRDMLFAVADLGGRQTFSPGAGSGYGGEGQQWRLYVFTDRPAYRPGDSVQWKLVARWYDGQAYSTPSGQELQYEVHAPQGAKVQEGKLPLNAFGAAWGTLEVTKEMALGEYTIQFWNNNHTNGIGGAALFRLEEYKLPEFKVAVKLPEENGRKQAFKLGDTVEVEVQADYYFGGPVAAADVEVRVYQNPFQHGWWPPHDYPWFYEDMRGGMMPPWRHRGSGQVVKEERLKTDATGKAVLRFETPANDGQDFEYRVEARVVDASRREITASDTVRVTRQRYYVYLNPEHYVHHPGDRVKVDIKAMDANDEAAVVEGLVTVSRELWIEVWLDPTGREVKGPELTQARRDGPVFPPPPPIRGRPWRLKFQGWQHDEVLKRPAKTDAKGEASIEFTPEREGYYRVAWASEEEDGNEIKADTAVWVATTDTTDVEYRHGSLSIIVDKDTFRAGGKTPAMIVAPTNDVYVLFSVEREGIMSWQVLHLTGSVKLVELEVTEKHVPNVFLCGLMAWDRQVFTDEQQVVVPPLKHFLEVDVKPDRAQYQPQEEGSLTVSVRDSDGKPVAAEVALGVADEAVYYIQQDYAGDPRQVFFGSKRPHLVQTQVTTNQRSFTKLVLTKDNQLIDERQLGSVDQESEGQEMSAMGMGMDMGTAYGGAMMGAKAMGFGGMGGGMGGGMITMDAAMPAAAAPAAPGMMGRPMRRMAAKSQMVAGEAMAEPMATMAPPDGPGAPVTVRTDFRATVFWQPDVITDANGQATVKVKYPDSLTGWKATARVASRESAFGIATATTRTKMPLLVRLQAPRFFVVGDTVTISAVVNNNTDQALPTAVDLEAAGLVVKGVLKDGKVNAGVRGGVKVPANGEARVDWQVSVEAAGKVKLKTVARAGKLADAMEKEYEAFEHGIDKLVCKSGKVRANEVTLKLDLPKERRAGSTALTVQVAPSMAVTLLDALPYLLDYPYGCTEQTMSRFLPAVIVAKTFRDLGLKPEDIMGRVFGGVEPGTADRSHPEKKRDLTALDDITAKGLERLYDFQHGDGGWAWWKEGDSDHYMTAYVLWGLSLARGAGVKVKDDVLERAVAYLDKELVEEEASPDMQAWCLHALAEYHAVARKREPTPFQAKAFANLFEQREKLNAYARALLTLCAQRYGYADQATTLVENLRNGAKTDATPDTSIVMQAAQASQPAVIPTTHWGEDGVWWHWSDGPVESTSLALRALLAVNPKHELVEGVSNWLVRNRRGAQWSNTRDTAMAVLALCDYLRVSGEVAAEIGYEVTVNGQRVAERKLRAEEALAAPARIAVPAEAVRDGTNEVRIRRTTGQGPLYVAAEARFFSLEEPVTPAGNELFVRRQYYRLAERPTLLKGIVTDRGLLPDNGTLVSGERVEVVVTIEAKNDYEYLVFEDLKPAGLEAVEVKSGTPVYARQVKSRALDDGVDMKALSSDSPLYRGERDPSEYTGRQQWVYQELRDRKVALFVDRLPQGFWEIRYQLRGEVPGQFHALPLIGHAMYVPEIRANGAEVRLTVDDRK